MKEEIKSEEEGAKSEVMDEDDAQSSASTGQGQDELDDVKEESVSSMSACSARRPRPPLAAPTTQQRAAQQAERPPLQSDPRKAMTAQMATSLGKRHQVEIPKEALLAPRPPSTDAENLEEEPPTPVLERPSPPSPNKIPGSGSTPTLDVDTEKGKVSKFKTRAKAPEPSSSSSGPTTLPTPKPTTPREIAKNYVSFGQGRLELPQFNRGPLLPVDQSAPRQQGARNAVTLRVASQPPKKLRSYQHTLYRLFLQDKKN